MGENVLLVRRLDVLVVEGLVRLGVDPSDVEGSVLEATVEVLDQAGDVRELERTLDREGAVRFDLPTGARRTERSDFGVSRHDDDLLEVDQATELGEFRLGVDRLELGERKREVRAGRDLDLRVDLLGGRAMSDLVVRSVVLGDRTTSRGSLVELGADVGRETREVGKLVHASVELRERAGQLPVWERSTEEEYSRRPRRVRFEPRRRREGA